MLGDVGAELGTCGLRAQVFPSLWGFCGGLKDQTHLSDGLNCMSPRKAHLRS